MENNEIIAEENKKEESKQIVILKDKNWTLFEKLDRFRKFSFVVLDHWFLFFFFFLSLT